MTLEEAKQLIPSNYKIELNEGRGFWRCMIKSDIGQPKGIGEAENPGLAVEKAVASWKRDCQ